MSEIPGSSTGDDPDAFDQERLGLLQQSLDPITVRRLEAIGVQPGWRCLEVGAGYGSVARWLAERVGPSGQVVATDLDTRFLTGQNQTPLEVRQHNILTDDLETDTYDLVHCRALLMHLSDPALALKKMAAAVRPGGWLFVEEMDGSSFSAVDRESQTGQEFDRIQRAIHDSLRAWRVMDIYLGRQLRGLLESLGLVDIHQEGITGIGRGGEVSARFQQQNLSFLRPLVSAGVLTEADLTLLENLYTDPSFVFVEGTCFGAWGQREQE